MNLPFRDHKPRRRRSVPRQFHRTKAALRDAIISMPWCDYTGVICTSMWHTWFLFGSHVSSAPVGLTILALKDVLTERGDA